MNDLVSIIIPCFNQAQYLPETLSSVLNQTYNKWECIIVNDGSIDNTEQVAQQWTKKDNRFSYVFKPNTGVSDTRNTGIKAAKGTLILPLDADDKIGENYLELAVNAFKEDSNLKLFYSNAEKIGQEQGIWKLEPFSLKRLALSNMIFCSAVFRKKEWERVGGYDTNMIHGLEDWEFWIALLKDGGNVKKTETVCFYYRIKKDSRNNSFDESQKKELIDYITAKHAQFYNKILGNHIELHKKMIQNKKKMLHLQKSKKNAFNVLSNYLLGINIFK